MTRKEYNEKTGKATKGSDMIPRINSIANDDLCIHCYQGHHHTWDQHEAAINERLGNQS